MESFDCKSWSNHKKDSHALLLTMSSSWNPPINRREGAKTIKTVAKKLILSFLYSLCNWSEVVRIHYKLITVNKANDGGFFSFSFLLHAFFCCSRYDCSSSSQKMRFFHSFFQRLLTWFFFFLVSRWKVSTSWEPKFFRKRSIENEGNSFQDAFPSVFSRMRSWVHFISYPCRLLRRNYGSFLLSLSTCISSFYVTRLELYAYCRGHSISFH